MNLATVLAVIWLASPIIILGGVVVVCEWVDRRRERLTRLIIARLDWAYERLEAFVPPHERGLR